MKPPSSCFRDRILDLAKSHLTQREIALALGISTTTVNRYLQAEFGKKKIIRRWTPQEIAKLEGLAETLPLPVLAQRLHRTPKAVELKLRALSYSCRSTLDNYSANYLAQNLGYTSEQIKRWITKGYLLATKVSTGRWAIAAKDFASFCRNYPEKIKNVDPQVIAWLAHEEIP